MQSRTFTTPLCLLPYFDEFTDKYRENELQSFPHKRMLDLLKIISGLPETTLGLIFSVDKTYSDPCYKDLLPTGLHYLRCLYSDFIYRKSVSNEPLLRNGFIRVPGFMSSDEVNGVRAQLLDLVLRGKFTDQLHPRQFPLPLAQRKLLNYMRDSSINWGGMYFCGVELIREQTGMQSVPHTDTFHPTLKAWIALEDVPESKGPLQYLETSHELNNGRLDLEQEKLLRGDVGDRGSFRFTSSDINRVYSECHSIPLGLQSGELLIVNTRGIHFRGRRQEGEHRLSIHASMRCSPFLLPQPICSEWEIGHSTI